MKKIILFKALFFYILFNINLFAAETNFLEEGIKYYEKKDFKKSKIFFERDIVFNPESEKSYLYLAKIFNNNKNDEEQEINLNNTLLINPNNDEAKILFERDIVFNPKSENSNLYLAKIFYEQENDEEQEINLTNVLLLNPKNDEAIYMLTLLKIKQYDYSKAKELIDQFNLVCKSFCSKKNEIQEKFSKLTPEDAKSEN